MTVYLNYKMPVIDGKNEEIETFFKGINKEIEIEDNLILAYGEEETYLGEDPIEKVYISKAVEEIKQLMEVIQGDFTVEGTIDTSETAGEYMDFQIQKREDQMYIRVSDWYLEADMESFEEYEDFCDNYFECGEDTFNELKDKEFVYILETDEGEMLCDEIPLGEERKVEV